MSHPNEHRHTYAAMGFAFVIACAAFGANPVRVQVDLSSPNAAKAWHFEDATWRVGDGMIEQTDPELRGTFAWLKSPAFGKLIYEGEFMALPEGKGVKAASLVFGSSDSDNLYWTHFDCRNSQLIMYLIRQGQTKELLRVRRLKMPLNTWHKVRVEHDSPSIKVYLNGKLVASLKDTTHPKGLIGVRCGQGHIRFRNLRAEGTRAKLDRPWRALRPQYQVVCDDAGVGSYEAFPDVIKLQNGDLLCAFYAGYSHVSIPNKAYPKGGRIVACRSSDGGKTWGKPQTLVDSPLDDRDPSLCQLKDGTLICNFFCGQYTYQGRKRVKRPEYDRTNDVYVVRSFDNGHTWETEPRLVPSPFASSHACSSPIIELHDGTLLLPTYGNSPGKKTAVAFIRSRDRGETWGDTTVVADDHNHYEPAVIQLPDKSLLCTIRPCMCITRSTDLGHTWTPRKRMGIPGHASYLLRTSAGILLNAHRIPGTSVEYSLDDGATWSKPVQIDSCTGAYPSMAELDDGSVLVVYYNDRGRKGHGIRARRFRVGKGGIEFVEHP